MYPKLNSAKNEFPDNIFNKGIPNHPKNTVSRGPFRLVSLYLASQSKYGIIVPSSKNNLIEVRITDYDKKLDDELWELIQVSWNLPGGAPNAQFYVRNLYTQTYLHVSPSYQVSLKMIEPEDSDRFLWSTNWGDRGIFFCDPNTGYYCSDGISVDPKSSKINVCNNYDQSWPLEGGKPFLRIVNESEIIMSSVKSMDFYKKTRKNDIENDWYLLYDYETTFSCPIPVTTSLSINEMLNWKPNYHSQFNRCMIELQERFIDRQTQPNIQHNHLMKICASIDNSGTDQNIQIRSNPIMYNFQFWQYIDLLIIAGNDQGWVPLELKNIQSSVSNLSLFDLLDGKRPGQGSQINIPLKQFVENGHQNGVKVFGSIFFQETYYGGKWKWWKNFLNDPKKSAQKCMEIVKYYQFDGFFINFETMPYEYVGNNGQCTKCKNPIGNLYGPKNETSFFQPQKTDPEYGNYWCHYDPHGQGGPWNPGCNNAPCFRCIPQDLQDATKEKSQLYQNLIEFLRQWKKMKKLFEYEAQIIMYECINKKGDVAYYGGINDQNIDLWIDQDGKKLVDYMFTMIPGGGIVPKGQTSTYIQTSESALGCSNHFDKLNYQWPIHTGPNQVKGQCIDKEHPCAIESYKSHKDIVSSPRACVCNDNSCVQSKNAKKLENYASYDFFASLNVSGFKGLKIAGNTSIDGVSWENALYCGNFSSPSSTLNCKMDLSSLPLTSLGLWDVQIYEQDAEFRSNYINNSKFWISYNGNVNTICPYDETKWKGISYYTTEKSVYSKLPFYTNFSLGNGNYYYIQGIRQDNFGSWNDYIQSYLPTWSFWTLQSETGIMIEYDYSDAYEGGNSLKIYGTSGCQLTDFILYKTKFSQKNNIKITIIYKYDKINSPANNSSLLSFNYTTNISFPKLIKYKLKYSTIWKSQQINIRSIDNSYINSFGFSVDSCPNPFQIFIGSIYIHYQHQDNSNYYASKPIIINHFKNNYNISWKGISDMFYIYNGSEFMGRIRGSKNSIKTYNYNIQNAKNNSFSIKIPNQKKILKENYFMILSPPSSYQKKNKLFFWLGIPIILLLTLVIIYSLIKRIKPLIIVGLFIITLILLVLIFVYKDKENFSVSYFMKSLYMNPQLSTYPISRNLLQSKIEAVDYAKKIYINLFKQNQYLANVFYNTYLNPILHLFRDTNDEMIYCITGNWGKDPPGIFSNTDMSGMWLRDSCFQAHSYIPLAVKSLDVRKMIVRILKQCYFFVLQDSYANAFNQEPVFNTNNKQGQFGYVTTKNYEPDSLIFVLWLAFDLFIETNEKEQFRTPEFLIVLKKIVTQLQAEQNRGTFQFKYSTENSKMVNPENLSEQSVYRFNELPNGGIGSYVGTTGLSWSGFRPSDDIQVFGFNIPTNMLIVSILSQYMKLSFIPNDLKQQISNMIFHIESGLVEWAIYEHFKYGKIYAYETDGLLNQEIIANGKDTTFQLNNKIMPNCNIFNDMDMYGNKTNCSQFFGYEDGDIQRNSCMDEHYGCSTRQGVAGDDIKLNILAGTRHLEVKINNEIQPYSSYHVENNKLIFKQVPSKNSLIKIRGNFNIMDDANLPSLLSIPYFKYKGNAWDPHIYKNTRKFILSQNNLWYYELNGYSLKGIGSGHTAFMTKAGPNCVWPISLITQYLTSKYDEEKKELLKMILDTTKVELKNKIGPTPTSIAPLQSVGYIHESVWIQDSNFYTRGNFGWANAFFSEMIQKNLL